MPFDVNEMKFGLVVMNNLSSKVYLNIFTLVNMTCGITNILMHNVLNMN